MLNKILQKDKQIDWELFISRHQENSVGFSYLVFTSMTPGKWFQETTGLPFALRYSKRVGDNYYWSISEIKTVQKLLYKNGAHDPLFYLRLIKNAQTYCDILNTWCQTTKGQNFSQKTNVELLELYKIYWENLRRAAALMWVKHNLNGVLERRIRQNLRQIPKLAPHEQEVFSDMLTPSKDTLITQANKQLSKLANKKKLNNQEKTKWLDEYNWIETFTWLGKELNNKSFSVRLIQAKKNNLTVKPVETLGNIETLSLHDFSLFADREALRYLLYFHTYQLESLFAAHYKAKNLLKEIASRINLSFEELPYAIYPEISSALEGKPVNKKRVLSRKNNQIALYRFDQKITLIDEENFKKIKSANKQPQNRTSVIKGNSAFLGKVIGRIIVVKTKKDFDKFSKGEILVAPMTTIDFTPHLNQAKAIVTDEGGITCHAAIVARELKIPCVIGTKTATQILKDGDLVEVDAKKGIVRLLK